MDKLILGLLSATIAFILGLVIGESGTITTDDHKRIVNNLESDIKAYQDYVNAIEPYIQDSIFNIPAIQVLNAHLPNAE